MEFNDTYAPISDDVAVHRLVEAQVERTPDAMAVAYGTERLTYRELNERANQLAHYLAEQGIGCGSLIAVFVERGIEMIIALLGVLKTGAAYVPMDPDYPRLRLEFMLTDTQASLVITQRRLQERLPSFYDRSICIDDAWPAIATAPTENPTPQAGPRDLAYIIYTSGSTGTPKGVMVEHQALSNRMQAMRSYYQIEASDRTLQFASTVFDASLEQIFPTLMSGGMLLVRESALWSARQFIDYVREQQITVAELTPSMWAQVVDCMRGQHDLGDQFRLMILAGEAVRAESVAAWFAVSSAPLINGYGPTEATITATACTLHPGDKQAAIGRPIANTEVFVVDENDQLVPIGTPGELLIGGVGVARGYLNRPELTAKCFTSHPFSPDTQRRVYRTGDIVRWLPDGHLEFIGRTDDQVKLRGMRIELGEIESLLVSHNDVTSAVAIVREDTPGDKRLVAYCLPRAGSQPTAQALAQWCREALPPFMVPNHIVVVDEFPLTVAGKLDRHNLPAPYFMQDLGDARSTGPLSDVEELIAEIWQEILNIDHIKVNDNFFALGGHSLLATQVVNRIDLFTDVQIDLKFFFGNPTVASLARHLLDRFEIGN
ncbi:non-ribosomal peptide synthetase [Streptomyces violaceusniger]|uniref:non-ribosomal peptide synthetase n=1 Tax=Streptomyces violaceusniger TaxID=68280 RepID=UPI000686DC0B|nr:non-ribosomal peptide synthetase [Streptomyces violaceusniger]